MTYIRSMRTSTLWLVAALLLSLLLIALGPQRSSAQAAWAPGVSYAVGAQVTYNGRLYQCQQAHTSQVGWEPSNVPALWIDRGPAGTVPTATRTRTNTTGTVPTATRTRTNTPGGPTATRTRTRTNTQTGGATATRTRTRTNTSTGPSATRTRTNTQTTGNYPAWAPNVTYAVGARVSHNGLLWECIYAHTSNTAWEPQATPTLWKQLPGTAPTATTGPTATRTNTPQPCTNCGGSLPKHVITGYWHNFNNGSTVLRLRDVPSQYNLIAIAFAEATSPTGAVNFILDASAFGPLGYTDADFRADINTLHGQGRKVIISVGGERGNVIVNDSTSATNFANSIVSLMDTYRFDGVDIDLEHGINSTYLTQALRNIAGRKPGVIITMAPQTIDMQSTGTEYFKLALNIKDILSIVNMQYYNSGTMLGCNGAVYAQGTIDFLVGLACIQLQGGLRPDQVGLGLPAVQSAAGGGYVSPSVVNNALSCLAAGTNCGSFRPSQTWPGIRGAMTWSINWDATSSYNWSRTINSHLPSVP